MASAMWLAAYADGALRLPCGGDGNAEHRRRVFLPPLPSLRQALQRSGGKDFDEKCLYHLRSQCGIGAWATRGQTEGLGLPTVALIRVSHGTHYHGPLTPWGEASFTQWLMHGSPADAYSLQVDAVKQVVTLHDMMFRVSRHHGSGGMARLSLLHPLFTGVWHDPAGEAVDANQLLVYRQRVALDVDVHGEAVRPAPAKDVLHHWGLPGHHLGHTIDDHMSPTLCLG